jgi:hypothetical protein
MALDREFDRIDGETKIEPAIGEGLKIVKHALCVTKSPLIRAL